MAGSQKIIPCLWFDSQAEEAAQFYTSLFAGSSLGRIVRYGDEFQEITGRPPGSVMTIEFELGGFRFVGLNGGPQFVFTPAISFFVMCETEKEVDTLWGRLLDGGSALMELGPYPWSEKYGWVKDRYGLTWQIALGKISDVGQKIAPSLLFVGKQAGRAEEALRLYTSIFPGSKVDGVARWAAGEGEPEGTVKHAQFGLSGEKFMVMDSSMGHDFGFNEAISLQILCATQEEVDHYWSRLTAGGGKEAPCGWLEDPFGVSWQVVPTILHEMLSGSDRAKTQRATRAMMQMKKFDIAALERAYSGTGT